MNINEIAELAGVSRATVSRYLNDGYVSEEKRGSNPESDRRDRLSPVTAGEKFKKQSDKAGRCDHSGD